MYTRIYKNISSLKLAAILKDLKSGLLKLIDNNPELLFKCEFILEELLTNSFSYTCSGNVVDIQIYVELNHLQIEYREIGVPEIDFLPLLLPGQKIAANLTTEKAGGLGLYLINQMAQQFTVQYNTEHSTRIFNISL